MKKKDLMSVAVAAVGTATLTVAGFLANPIEAGGGADGPAAAIATPKLKAGGLELTLTPAQGRVFQTGDQPAFELHAVNTLPQATTVKVCVSMLSSAPASMISRAMPIATEVWREEQSLTFKADETRTILFQARTNLPANRQFFVYITVPVAPEQAASDKVAPRAPVQGIMALTFSTIPTKAAPAPTVAVLGSLRP